MSKQTHRSKLLPGITFVVCLALLGVFVGGVIGRSAVPKSHGLAGAAEVLGYVLVLSIAFIVIGILLVKKFSRRRIVRSLLFVGPLALMLVAYGTWRFMQMKAGQDEQWQNEQERYKQLKPTAPAVSVMFASQHAPIDVSRSNVAQTGPVLGLGIGSPILERGVFHFYNEPDMDQLPATFLALDSLTFAKGEHFTNITSAPPWFLPAHMKLDYDLLLLKVITLARNWVEVEVNMLDGTTRWVDRQELEIVLWPEFISTVGSVEILDPVSNPIRIKPLDHASVLADGAGALLNPLAVQGDWLMVGTSELADRIAPTGWIRWRDGERLLVRYNLLC
ncbi:MAG: hypothetical protein KA408_01280 [Flavobacteriales bacterium]|nr:hypothetical protein [Flavobacteriales bacterium]